MASREPSGEGFERRLSSDDVVYAGDPPLDLETGTWVDGAVTGEWGGPVDWWSTDGDAWPSGEGPGPVVSPAGRLCGTLPTEAWVKRWFKGLGQRSSHFTRYDGSYALAVSPPAYVDMKGITEDEYDDVAESVDWAKQPDEHQTSAAVAVLDCEVSADVLDALAEPLRFLSRRLIFNVERSLLSPTGTGVLRARIPLFDLTTTPITRVLRRFESLEEQSGGRINQGALDGDTQDLFNLIHWAVLTEFPLYTVDRPDEILLHFEDIDDRVYNPVIGLASPSSPFVAGLWSGGGVVGLLTTMLMPSREPPPVFAFPLNWAANNWAEFVGTVFEWWDSLDQAIASHYAATGLVRDVGLADWLGWKGVTDLSDIEEVRGLWEGAGGHVVVMTDEVSGLLLDDLLDRLSSAKVGLGISSTSGDSGDTDSVDTAGFVWRDDPTTWWYDPKHGDTTTASDTRDDLVPWYVDLAVVGVLAASPWVWVPYLIAKDDLEDVVAEVSDALADAFTTLSNGLEEAAEPGRPLNDALVIALMTAGSACELARSVSISKLFKKDIADLIDMSASFEEKLLLGLEDTSNYRALAVGLAGQWYESWLSEGETLAAELSSAAGCTLSQAIDELREQHEAAVPVWTVDEGFYAWQFVDFEPYTWYYHQTSVEVFASGNLAAQAGSTTTTRDLAAWVSAVSPLVQLVMTINLASTLLEAGLQAESFILAISGLPTGDDSLAQQSRFAFDALDMSKIREVLPDISIPRFVGAVWRQALTDRLLLDLEATGYDMDCVYEVVRWMRDEADRDRIDTLLGPLDADLGRRRYEEGLIGKLGRYGTLSAGAPEEWLLYGSLDEAWGELTCEEREAWTDALPSLVNRSRLEGLSALIEATRSDSGSAEEEPDIVDESDRLDLERGLDLRWEEWVDESVLLELERLERLAADGATLGLEREILAGEVLYLYDAGEVGSLTGWDEVLTDEDLASARRWATMAQGMGHTRATMLRSWVGE